MAASIISRLKKTQIEAIRESINAIVNGPFVEDIDFLTLFGKDRNVFSETLELWPRVYDLSTESDHYISIIGSLSEMGRQEIDEILWMQWFSVPQLYIIAIFEEFCNLSADR